MKYLIEVGLSSKKTKRMFRAYVEFETSYTAPSPIDHSLFDVIIDLTNRWYDPAHRGKTGSRTAIERSTLPDSIYWAYKAVPLMEYSEIRKEVEKE